MAALLIPTGAAICLRSISAISIFEHNSEALAEDMGQILKHDPCVLTNHPA
jgi:hypothetical protein